MTVWFDMDGTIADFYGVSGWLEDLRRGSIRPYEEAKPLFPFAQFAKMLHKVQKRGYEIGIVTWGSKTADEGFDRATALIKQQWLRKHLPSVQWNHFQFMAYGTNKNAVNAGNDILFDDEERNRMNWTGAAFEPCDIMNILKEVTRQ